jgi:hypothetical protein
MPRRMRAYVALAEEKYQQPTYPVLINMGASQSRKWVVGASRSLYIPRE